MGSEGNNASTTVLMLNYAWRDLEDHLDFSKKAIEEANLQLQVREDGLDLIRNSIAEASEAVELLRKSVDSRCEDLERREAEFSFFQRDQIEYLRLREEQMENRFAELRRRVEERIDDANLREERVSLMLGELELAQEAMVTRSREFVEEEAVHESRLADWESEQIQIDKRIEDLRAEEKQHEERSNGLLQREEQAKALMVKYKKRSKGLKLREKVVEDRYKELDVLHKLNEEKGKKIELKGKELHSAEVSFDQYLAEFRLKEKQFKSDKKEFDKQMKELADKSKEIEETRKLLDQHVKEAEVERKHLHEQRRDVELKEQQLTNGVNSHVIVETEEEMPSMSSGSAVIHFTVTMNGKNLQMFLNENVNNQDSMHEEIIKVLRLSRDPATVILDAMEGFYPSQSTKGDNKYTISVVRKTCILLLQQLRKISPRIQSITKERALKLAEEWKEKVSLTDYDCLEALGLLNLLASFGLVSSFAANYILTLLETIAHHSEVFELCGVPCFADKLPDFVERLIENAKYVVAVKLICTFNLVDKFSPVALLRQHINRITDTTCEAQDKALNGRIASIEEVIKCIGEFDLHSQFPLRELESSFETLSKQKTPRSNEIGKHDDSNIVDTKVDSDLSSDTQMSIVTCFLGMDGRYLLQFLSKHTMEFDLMQKNISKALKMSSDLGRIVIVAIMEEVHGRKIPSYTMMSFIFVLELLAGNIPIEIIKCPDVLKAAMKVAVGWKKNSSGKKDPLCILGFLQLVCTYKLISEFDSDEFYSLCCYVADAFDGLAPELSEILSFSENVPVSKILNIDQKKINQSVELPKKAPWDSLPHGTVPDLFRLSSDPARLLLDMMQFFFRSILNVDARSTNTTMEVFLPLLQELVKAKVEVDIQNIQAEAYTFACDWKEIIGLLTKGQAFCFLLYLSIYKLSFDVEEILHLLIFCNNSSCSRLLRDFGLEKEMVEHIRNIAAKEEQFVKAVDLIYTFELMDKLPPVPLINNYLACAKEATEKICHQNHTPEEILKAVEKEMEAVHAVIRCISVHKLQSMFPPNPVERRLKELTREKEAAGENVSRLNSNQRHVRGKKKRRYLTNSELETRKAKKVCNGVSSKAGSTSK